MSTKYRVGDFVRLQLSPKGKDCRWSWDENWSPIDRGYGGPWVDALITANYIEGKPTRAWPPGRWFEARFDCPITNTGYFIQRPTEDHIAFKILMELPGYPLPPQGIKEVNNCGCGAGNDAPGHMDYCPRLQDLKALGMWDGP